MIEFRLPIETDKPLIDRWIKSDPYHVGKMTADFFYFPLSISLVLGNKEPGLFVRIDPIADESARLHIQFSPDEIRSARVMLGGWEQFKERCKSAGVKRLVFDSTSPKLIAFCEKHFGFLPVEGTDDYSLSLES